MVSCGRLTAAQQTRGGGYPYGMVIQETGTGIQGVSAGAYLYPTFSNADGSGQLPPGDHMVRPTQTSANDTIVIGDSNPGANAPIKCSAYWVRLNGDATHHPIGG
ncbi:hypothetical protein ABIA33_007428 [Streptacidiphilus sp. MAP12-16]|uniref:hypothetical protein n=1 Tax=Streptacidiphilus sp. MAP12-16 TaxID=3156300 RepID=UPI0035139CD7